MSKVHSLIDLGNFLELAKQQDADAATRTQLEREQYERGRRLDALGPSVPVGSRAHKQALQLQDEIAAVQREIDGLRQSEDRRAHQIDALGVERDGVAQHLARLEAAIAPGGDLQRRIRALDAQRQELIDTIHEYQTQAIPALRRRLAQYG